MSVQLVLFAHQETDAYQKIQNDDSDLSADLNENQLALFDDNLCFDEASERFQDGFTVLSGWSHDIVDSW